MFLIIRFLRFGFGERRRRRQDIIVEEERTKLVDGAGQECQGRNSRGTLSIFRVLFTFSGVFFSLPVN